MRQVRHHRTGAAALGALLVAAGAAALGLHDPSATATPTGGTATDPCAPPPSAPAASALRNAGRAALDGMPTKVLVVLEENEARVSALRSMPYLSSLATTYAQATHYCAVTHPSLPNYLAIAGGSTLGVTDDRPPAQHPLAATSVFGQALAAGHTAATFAEDMPRPCTLVNSGTHAYVPRHNPWTYFVPERAACATGDLPAGTTDLGALQSAIDTGTLPDVGMLVPDLCDDGHDCPLATADAWLASWLPRLMAGPDYAQGRLAVVITFDEGFLSNNTVAFVVVSPYVSRVVVTTPLTHYSLSRSLSATVGAPPLLSAASAPAMPPALHLPS